MSCRCVVSFVFVFVIVFVIEIGIAIVFTIGIRTGRSNLGKTPKNCKPPRDKKVDL